MIRPILLVLMYCFFASQLEAMRITSVTFLSEGSDKPQLIFQTPPESETPVVRPLPHWKDDNTDAVPAVCISGQRLQAMLTISFDNGDEEFTIKGTSAFATFRESTVSISDMNPESKTATVTLASENPVQKPLGKYETTFEWSIEFPSTHKAQSLHTDATFYVPLKKPLISAICYEELMDFACTCAAGLTDEKDICNSLVKNLHKTGIQYGEPGWDTFNLLRFRQGMCGGFSKLFRDLCASIGLKVSSWFFTLRNHKNHRVEKRWMALDILHGGLNNHEPTTTTKTAFSENVYPLPRYFSNSSDIDDIDFTREKALYRFATESDGHCVNFLKYGNTQIMYDPSFGAGPFEGFFQGTIPENQDMSGESLRCFRKQYLDSSVGHLQGRLLCVRKDGSQKKMIISPRTTLIPDHEVCVYWTSLDMPPSAKANQQIAGRRISRFSKLYSTKNSAREKTVDYFSLLKKIQSWSPNSQDTDSSQFADILRRRIPLKTLPGTQLPGILPPLESLQRAIVLHMGGKRGHSLSKEITNLKERADGTLGLLLSNGNN